MKVTIERISRKDRMSAKGPYIQIGIMVQGEWLSGFGAEWNAHWQSGDSVDIEIVEVEKEGKVYKNFRPGIQTNDIHPRITELELQFKGLQDELISIKTWVKNQISELSLKPKVPQSIPPFLTEEPPPFDEGIPF